jgi:hypothetical protein
MSESDDDAERLMGAIRELGDRVRQDGAWTAHRIAESIGVEPHGAFARALATLHESGEWVALGQARARVYRPADEREEAMREDEVRRLAERLSGEDAVSREVERFADDEDDDD